MGIRVAPNHKIEDSVFEKIVTSKADATAMIAYCFYKLEKLKYLSDNPNLDEAHKETACLALIAGGNLDRIKRDAEEFLRRTSNEVVQAYIVQSNQSAIDCIRSFEPKHFWKCVWEGIVAGILVAVAIPFVWALLYYGLLKLDWWNPFVSMVDSLPKK